MNDDWISDVKGQGCFALIRTAWRAVDAKVKHIMVWLYCFWTKRACYFGREYFIMRFKVSCRIISEWLSSIKTIFSTILFLCALKHVFITEICLSHLQNKTWNDSSGWRCLHTALWRSSWGFQPDDITPAPSLRTSVNNIINSSEGT